MTALLLLFSIGVILASYLSELPSPTYFFASLVVACSGTIIFHKKLSSYAKADYIKSHYFPMLIAFIFGMTYGIISGYRFINLQLPDELVGADIIIEGQVVGLPQEDTRRQLFTLNVERMYLPSQLSTNLDVFPQKVNLSSYGQLRVKTGEHWRFSTKLKKPRGFVNPGGFDYQIALLRRGVGAMGYIRDSPSNELLKSQTSFSMDVLRYNLQQWLIQKSHSPDKGILVALLVGDTSLVGKDQWNTMTKTGTNHLIAISGLHLGFFAIAGFFIGNFLGRFIQLVWPTCPAAVVGYYLAFLFAAFYSVIAGFSIPTLRTLIMLAVVQFAYLSRKSFRGRDTLFLALVLVLLYDPLAAFDIGFWLSFGAVGMLVFCFSGRISLRRGATGHLRLFSYFIEFVKSQWVMFVGLLVPLSIFVHTSSLLAPAANLIAIPLVTFFVVPCLILSAVCHFIFERTEDFFLHCAEWGLLVLREWLEYLLGSSAGQLNPLVNFNIYAIVLAAMSVLLILMPRGLGNKYFGCGGLLLAFIIPLKELPALQMLVFDVGQGTAILLRTPNHELLYDTGPQYTENFDAGSALVVPYLHSQGLGELDAIVVSHSDMDHAGGLIGVLGGIDVNSLWLGEPNKFNRTLNDPEVRNCHSIKPWRWDNVNFEFISWPISSSDKTNNHSCVLMIDYEGHRILLAGDIEKDVEKKLVAGQRLAPVEILLAPHHGSKTSSTSEFVAQTAPKYIVYSTGYRNQHGHPHKNVRARYHFVNAVQLNTATDGAIEFEWQGSGAGSVKLFRQSARRYWFAKDSE